MIRSDLRFAFALRPLGSELHQIHCTGERTSQLKVTKLWIDRNFQKVWSEKKARMWMILGLAAIVALQIYFVQELLAALILFTGVFAVFAVVALILYLIDRAGQWGLGWAGHQARRGLTLAEDISKKQLRRPRSETAQ